ncbi:MAG TPA: peptidoglycan DD-metalloendopeptidase family protein [Gemmatimonadaceae bacterium]|jgi:septal ring factor EnvC (AmiA/AmiB activator)
MNPRVILMTLLLGCVPLVLHAQDASARLRAQRDTLERIRRERETLERRAADLASSVHDLNEEVTNIDKRREATALIVKRLDTQLETITTEVDSANSRVTSTENELETKRVTLHKRLVDIYKRGPMQTTEALLSARSFGELIARYKYLHLLALHDRALVKRVEELGTQVRADQERLVSLRTALEESRGDKAREEQQLRSLESERNSTLTRTRTQVKQVNDRISQLKATEEKANSTIANLDAERRRSESARPAAARATSTIKTSDYGKLDWPVDGPLLYTFGKAQTASNTTIRWNGVGIRAAISAPVKSVASGKVVNVGPLGTYGQTVIIDHGGGDYSIYGSLSRADVRQGQMVAKGQVIGGVGISDPELPPHLHFEIRHAGDDGRPSSVDPATWLRGQR